LENFANQRSFGSGLLKILEIKEPPVPVFWKIWKEPSRSGLQENTAQGIKLGLQPGFFWFPFFNIKI